ncbi:MAG: MogA/MoaB family molybdenum cofactor biosynthesis protein [Acidobacteriota bacterium]
MVKKKQIVNREEEETLSQGGDPAAVPRAHRRAGAHHRAAAAVLTVSDTRTAANDGGGDLLVAKLEEAGHQVVERDWVVDEAEAIAARLDSWLADPRFNLVITTGGTGIARRDRTIELVQRRLDKELQGFGELFRYLSYDQVGAASMLSRATGGLAGNKLLFALPGSPGAVALALEKLLLPEMGHLLKHRED